MTENDSQASPFHPGELAVQERVGARDKVAKLGALLIRDHLTGQHRDFYIELPFLLAGTLDAEGWPWASILVGRPGFARPDGERKLNIDTRLIAGDPLANHLQEGAPIGLLGIELNTRRRNRVNGHVITGDRPGRFAVAVDQTFGNCPKYIQLRECRLDDAQLATLGEPRESAHMTALDDDAQRQVAAADTFFIASAFAPDASRPAHGCDVSHRGGKPGFVLQPDRHTLLFPDYIGNFMFNTLGNLQKDPRCGLLFIDFENGDTLQLSGTAEVLWDRAVADFAPGARRMLRFRLRRALRLRRAVPLRWDFVAFSPFLDGLR